MARHPIVRGGALYRADGRLIGTFGECPSMAVEDVEGWKYIAGERRYEFVLPLEQAGLPMIVTGIAVTQRRSGEKRSERELRAREKRLAGVV